MVIWKFCVYFDVVLICWLVIMVFNIEVFVIKYFFKCVKYFNIFCFFICLVVGFKDIVVFNVIYKLIYIVIE